uniref:non-specific serine/threonine protein kinase n=1 Tax=Schistosoma mansoni TaxID=6183 RepID=A0A3Q0KG94_SCHMA
MTWLDVITVGTKYLRRLHRLPVILLKQPRPFLLPRYSVPYPRISSNFGRLTKYIGNHSQANSLVRAVYRKIISSSTQQRPNSLLRVYRGFAGSVQLRHYVSNRHDYSFHPINKICKPKHESWFSSIFGTNKYQILPNLCASSADSINPKEFIAAGCNSAVWAAEVRQQYPNDNECIDKLAVKVLYNYYANSSYDGQANLGDDYNSLQNIPDNWLLLHRQIQRECELRPQTNHPNIVPLVGHFIDRAPQVNSANDSHVHNDNYNEFNNALSSGQISQFSHKTTQSKCWPGVEYFSEGFDNRPYTFYMLMPRFEATLDDLLRGNFKCNFEQSSAEINHEGSIESKQNQSDNTNLARNSQYQKTNVSNTFTPSFQLHSDLYYLFNSSLSNSAYIKHGEVYIPVEEIVAIIAQLFEAVAELEAHGIAHRDIKPNNILIRRRVPFFSTNQTSDMNNATHNAFVQFHLNWLNDKKLQITNSHFHVALTDFGCAIRTGHHHHHHRIDGNNNEEEYLNHSGNLALLAPEIVQIIDSLKDNSNNIITNKDYKHSDIWAIATLIYPLFGISNPFVDGTFSSVNYTEDSLPELPHEAPKIMTWILHQCLKRNPSERPNADEIADILHTWCLIRHFHTRQEVDIFKDFSQYPTNLMTDIGSLTAEFKNSTKSHQIQSNKLNNRLCDLLNVCWAGDWLSGAARPPNGVRSLFYSRATPGRLALCLNIVHQLECFDFQHVLDS